MPGSSLGIRDGLGTSQACRQLVDLFEPYVIAQERSDRWPGTQLFGHTAMESEFAELAADLPELDSILVPGNDE